MKLFMIILLFCGMAIGADTTSVKMPEAKILGWLDFPQAIYILDVSDPSYAPIKVDRSFAEPYFFQNLDRERLDLEIKWVYSKHADR